ncbi:MAG: hypothetical protein FJ150_01270 [Euryarchaeota archaeon]|nr:hypothetical protein [Euryarchaeota archaeon]
MNLNKKYTKIEDLILLIPAIAAFLLVLIPTLKYPWPLGWDIFFHIHMAKVYAYNGLVFVDPLLNAPTGKEIVYPPLFHFLLASLAILLKSDYFQLARFMQPFLAMSVVLSVSYVTKKLYGSVAGISAGFLILSSSVAHRFVQTIPENLALILLPLAVYFFYLAPKKEEYKYAAISGVILGFVALMHQAAPLCLFGTITVYTVFTGILRRNIKIFKSYGIFILVGLALASIWWAPTILKTIMPSSGVAGSASTSIPLPNRSMRLSTYPKTFGYLLLTFATIGGIFSLKRRLNKDLLVILWVLSMLLLSQAQWFGLNVISYRMLVYILLPLSILGGFGLSYIYNYLKEYNKRSYTVIGTVVLLAVFTLSTFYGFSTVTNPKIATFGSDTRFGWIQIAPPSSSEIDLANWFQKNGNRKNVMAITNSYTGIFISAYSDQPMASVSENYLTEKINKSLLIKDGIGYLVYDKRLAFSSPKSPPFIKADEQLIFYNKETQIMVPDYAKKVYENHDYIIFKIT